MKIIDFKTASCKHCYKCVRSCSVKAIKVNVEILDFEFAGNNVNLGVLEKNASMISDKKIGFGCVDSSVNEVDDKNDVDNLVKKAVEIVGKDNLLLDPDCGLRRAPKDVAFQKLKLMNDIKDKYS